VAGETPAPLSSSFRFATLLLLSAVFTCTQAASLPPTLQPVVEAEEDIYTYTNADNGAGPLWCHGSTCLVRIRDAVFASGLETLKSIKPLNNLIEIRPGGEISAPVRVPLNQPFTSYFTATVRGGSPPSQTLELLGQRAGSPLTMSYARVRLW
jgi:hypothetical protein